MFARVWSFRSSSTPSSSCPPSASPVLTSRRLPGKTCNHELDEFRTPNCRFACDACLKDHLPAWSRMFGCRACNFDLCPQCYVNHRKIEAWECNKCTFINTEQLECEVCGSEDRRRHKSTEEEANRCCVCFDAQCEVRFQECGHEIVCALCAGSIFALQKPKCPICRTQLKKRFVRL